MRGGIARVGLLLAAAAAIALMAWSGASAVSTPAAAANRRAAEATAKRLLEETPLPVGAQETSADESALSVLSGPGLSPARTPQLVQAHRFWRLSGAPEQAISWIEAHPPAGARMFERGASAKGGTTTSWEAAFSFGQPTRVLCTVWLSVLAARAKEGGTALRADAIVIWTRPRPAAERIPAGVKIVSVRVRDLRRRISFAQDVSGRGRVREIVALVEGLLRPQGGAPPSCPVDDGRDAVVSLAFRRSAGAPPAARVRISANGCGSIELWRGRRVQPPLEGALQALKGLRKVLKRTL